MIRKMVKMKLFAGNEEEYERRHNLLWPEMKAAIHEHGGHNYSIFLDPATLDLVEDLVFLGLEKPAD